MNESQTRLLGGRQKTINFKNSTTTPLKISEEAEADVEAEE